MNVSSYSPARGIVAEPPYSGEDLVRIRSLLLIACLFTMVGGYLDAYSYLAHGHVFANAQTGNFVFLAVDVSGQQWAQASRHLPPIAAFALGVAAAKLLSIRSRKHPFFATLLCQGIELAILTTLVFWGGYLPDAGMVPTLSFVAALQNTSFSALGPWSFNSAMTTGNLRSAVSGSILWMAGRETEMNRGKAAAFGFICLSFLVGALFGASYTRLNGRYTLAPCAALAAIGLSLTYYKRAEFGR